MMDFWGLQLALTRNGRRSCIWDKPGLGYSDPRFLKGHENDFMTFFPALVDALGESAPFILVGWGGGGEFVYEYATRFPQNVHSLVFLEAYPPTSSSSCWSRSRTTRAPRPSGSERSS
ncbi:hypothetical protein PINS_up009007 [Pythium insidiosum]|nr:hypothetical protein PINS_up009007 [Pythium insidiosum]